MNIRRLSIIICCCIPSIFKGYAQFDIAFKFAEKIDSVRLHETLGILASDSLEGRGTGESGEIKSSAFLSMYLQRIGIQKIDQKSYLQPISMYRQTSVPKHFLIEGNDFPDRYRYFNEFAQDSIIKTDSIFFIGYGASSENYNDLAGFDIKGKVVMMFSGTPYNKFGHAYTFPDAEWSDNVFKRLPKAVLIVRNDFSPFYDYSRRSVPENIYISDENKAKIPEIMINEALANRILSPVNKTVKQISYEIERDGIPQSVAIRNPITISGETQYQSTGSNNIIGYIPGNKFTEEYIVVSAHYDHVGKGYDEIYNGADDNASGVSSVLEIARLFAEAKKSGKGPDRSLVFLFPAAEESGLCGSDYYVRHPLVPLAKTIACVNLDMLGRIDDKYENITNDYVYVITHKTKSGTLKDKLEEINRLSYRLQLDYTHTSPDDPEQYFERSDQYHFARNNIPSIFFSSGEHADYHKPSDDADKINFAALQKRTKLAFLLIWELANEKTVKN
ncbi:MAG: M28 family peptidase [Candidatus Azobacteroides sp.]|nr:M28 family peptidase [Candidatus Azobacteroides sp.]